MARSISPHLSRVLEQLELDQPELVTMAELDAIVKEEGIATPTRVVAARLRNKGWLLATGQRGVWEFAPAAAAGAYSSADPLLPFKAFQAANPNVRCALSMQAAAWALGLADRAPVRIEVVFADSLPNKVPEGINASHYDPNLPFVKAKGMPSLPCEAILVHMASQPSNVRSWASVIEWLPEIAYDAEAERVLAELKGRPASIAARTGYLLQGMRPDIADAVRAAYPPKSKVRFGPRNASIRNNERWKIADTLLPFDPRCIERVR